MDDIATALTNSIAKDGQTIPTDNLPMGAYKHTNVGAATAQNHYARADQVQKGTLTYLTSVGGTADAITATAAIGMNALSAGMRFSFIPGADNATTTPTLDINSIGTKTIKRDASAALLAGDIVDGRPAEVLYDGTDMILVNPYNVKGEQAGDIAVADLSDAGALAALDEVTLSDMADLSAKGIIARFTNSTGAPEEGGVSSAFALDATDKKLYSKGGIQGGFKNLKISTADAGTSSAITADAITLEDSNGYSMRVQSVSETVDASGSGVNGLDTGSVAAATWYYLWIIAKADGTVAGVASTSSTAPTMPTGYTYEARVGAVRTKSGSAVFRGCIQYGHKAQFTAPWDEIIFSGSAGTTGPTVTWSSGAWGAYAPPTSAGLHVAAQVNGGSNVTLMVASNSSYGTYNSSNPPPIFWNGDTSPNATPLKIGLSDWIIPESANLYYACGLYTGGNSSQVTIMGWEDGL